MKIQSTDCPPCRAIGFADKQGEAGTNAGNQLSVIGYQLPITDN
jgi:hypothetical protein